MIAFAHLFVHFQFLRIKRSGITLCGGGVGFFGPRLYVMQFVESLENPKVLLVFGMKNLVHGQLVNLSSDLI